MYRHLWLGKPVGQKDSMLPKLILMTLAGLLTIADCLPAPNITIPAPEGYLNHGKNDLICVPIKWYDVLIFFFTNYISHAATVKSRPGQKFRQAARDFFLALAFPYSGLSRALSAFSELSRSKHALTKAYHAGALWVVEKYDWQSISEDSLVSPDQVIERLFRGDQLSTPQVQRGNQKSISPNGQRLQDQSHTGEAIPLEDIEVGQGSQAGEVGSAHEHLESASEILHNATTGEADNRASTASPKVSNLASSSESTTWAR